MNDNIKKLIPVAYIHTDFKEKFGIPRQSGRVSELLGKIVFEPNFSDKDFLRGIEEFSHLWIIFGFSKAERKNGEKAVHPTVRPPRLGGNKRIGVFASRSPFRPNGLGLSCVKFEKTEEQNGKTMLYVSGIDMLDGTPIYDIKPYIPYADCYPDAKGGYAEENKGHKLEINISDNLLKTGAKEKRRAILNCLADDPRPSYQNDSERIYVMNFAEYEIKFKISGKTLYETDIKTLL